MTDGYKRGWQRHQHRLESSWPLSRDAERPRRGGDEEGSQWDLSQPSQSPSFSGREVARPPQETSAPQVTTSGLEGVHDGARYSSGSGGESNDSGSDLRGGGNKNSSGGGSSGDTNSNRGGLSEGSHDAQVGGGIGDNFSVSEGSSFGLPAPPVIPSSPLPAIAALREVSWPQGHRQATLQLSTLKGCACLIYPAERSHHLMDSEKRLAEKSRRRRKPQCYQRRGRICSADNFIVFSRKPFHFVSYVPSKPSALPHAATATPVGP